MNEKLVTLYHQVAGTLGANVTITVMFPFPVTLSYIEAHASNDSDATVAVSGADTMSMAAQTIGDSGAGEIVTPTATEKAATAGEKANSLITITIDYDGDGGTAADDLNVTVAFLTGDGMGSP
jgi:hypothetical protein